MWLTLRVYVVGYDDDNSPIQINPDLLDAREYQENMVYQGKPDVPGAGGQSVIKRSKRKKIDQGILRKILPS